MNLKFRPNLQPAKQQRAIGSTALDNIAFEIISSYEEFTVESSPEVKDTVVFGLGERRFAYLCPIKEDPSSGGIVFSLDDTIFDQPHILLYEYDYPGNSILPKGKYRRVCLYENISVIYSLMTYEEKITDAVERLLELLTLAPLQKEKEFQKEFLFYWDAVAQPGRREIYLKNDNAFSVLSVFQSSECTRYIDSSVSLNDLDHIHDGNRKWQQHINITAIFLSEIFCKNRQNLVKQRITPHFLTTDHPNYYEFTTRE